MKQCVMMAALVAGVLTARAVEVDGVVATVGTETILRSDVMAAEAATPGAENGHFQESLNRLIERKLILKAAKDAKLTLQEWMVDNRVQEIIDNNFDGDRNKLIQMLTAQKMTYPDWRKRIKEDLIVSAMRWNTVTKNAAPTPKEMQAEYRAHPKRYQKEGTVSVSMLSVKPGAEKPAAFDEAKAKKYDKVVAENTFHADYVAQINKLKKGEVSPWIEMNGWSFQFRKDDETPGRVRSFAEAYEDIQENVRAANAERLYKEWMSRLKAETYIKVY